MQDKIGPFQVVDLPPARQLLVNFLDFSTWGHHMFGLLEVDVTVVRQFMEQHKARTGEGLSLTGYLAFCLARAIDEDKSVQAYLKGRKHLVLFDDVNVGIIIERQIDGTRVPLGYLIRRANHKTFREIHEEIRAIQATPTTSMQAAPRWLQLIPRLPTPLIKLGLALIRWGKHFDPAHTWVPMVGTVGITSVGMFGNSSGWGIAPVEHTLSLIVGGIARKPAVVGDQIEPREFLSLTVAFDHDIVDGAPAARFVKRLVELIERGYGLDEAQPGTSTGIATAPEAGHVSG